MDKKLTDNEKFYLFTGAVLLAAFLTAIGKIVAGPQKGNEELCAWFGEESHREILVCVEKEGLIRSAAEAASEGTSQMLRSYVKAPLTPQVIEAPNP